jgi:hypothetical protein
MKTLKVLSRIVASTVMAFYLLFSGCSNGSSNSSQPCANSNLVKAEQPQEENAAIIFYADCNFLFFYKEQGENDFSEARGTFADFNLGSNQGQVLLTFKYFKRSNQIFQFDPGLQYLYRYRVQNNRIVSFEQLQ